MGSCNAKNGNYLVLANYLVLKRLHIMSAVVCCCHKIMSGVNAMSENTKRTHKGSSLIAFPDAYIVIDIETTGLSPEWDSIIEIAAIKYKDGIKVDQFASLVRPDYADPDGTYIDDFIEELTGITNEMLQDAPSADSILLQYKDFLGDSVLVGHNVNFDINFLYDAFNNYFHTPFSNDYIDTMRISRRLHPEESHHRLKDLVRRYSFGNKSAHRALGDSELAQSCYACLRREVLDRYGSFDAFIKDINSPKQGLKASDITSGVGSYDTTHPLYQKVCVFTGALQGMIRKDAMQIVVDLGGLNGDIVTRKTNYLILGNNDYCTTIKDGKSSKQKKAEKLKLEGYDIEILSENVFLDLVREQ